MAAPSRRDTRIAKRYAGWFEQATTQCGALARLRRTARSDTASPRHATSRGRPAEGGIRMATYIVLSTFTDQGVRNVKDTIKRADAVRELARKMGVETKSIYWTLGGYDVVVTFEAPDDASMTALSLAVATQGNVRTQTLRAFSKDEVTGILGKLGH
jgi:uncharacterized protein with GYD domain